MLLVSAGLLLRSFVKVLDVDLGFQPDRAASIKMEYDDNAPPKASAAKRGEIFQQIRSRVRTARRARPRESRTIFLSGRTAHGIRLCRKARLFLRANCPNRWFM